MFSSEKWFAKSGGFYNGIANQSLRFNDNDSAYLSKTPSSASTNLKAFTFSTWVKRGNVSGASHTLFSAGANSNNVTMIRFEGNGITDTQLSFFNYTSGSLTTTLKTKTKFRDPSAWYNIIVATDTTQSGANKAKIYINGVLVTDWHDSSHDEYPNDDSTFQFGSNVAHRIGSLSYSATQFFDGYMAETNFIPESQVAYTEFGELKKGVWIPKKYTGSYGNNGFRLQFKEDGDGSSTASSSTIGADTANSNHFLDVNLDAYDSNMPDSPENNFATLNPINGRRNGYTLSEGNLKSTPTSAYSLSISTFANKSGLFYFEVLCLLKPSTTNNMAVGFDTLPALSTSQYIEKGVWDAGGVIASGDGSSHSSNVGGYTTGDILSVAYNLDTGKGWFRKNDGDWVNSGNPANDSGNIFTFTSGLYYTPTFMGYNTQSGTLWVANYGQDSSFAGNKTSGSANAQDINGIGDFYYAPPSGGFLALCTANLQEPTIGANSTTSADDHFNTVLWTGNGADDRSISGVGFQPDFTWLKQRNGTNYHTIFDSTRGATKAIYPNDTEDEATNADTLQAFEIDGFEVGTSGGVNGNNNTFVAWNWKAGGATPSKTYKVVVVSDGGNKYRFRNSADSATFGASAVALDLQEGGTYTFDYSDSTATSHPFRFSTTSDGTHGGGSEYTTGVVKDDTAKTITITLASSAPTLYYYCSSHSGMGGQVNTNATFGQTNFDGSILSVSNSNTTAGFSIVLYTGTDSSTETFGHGLGAVPAMVIIKSRDSDLNWIVYHKGVDTIEPQDYFLKLSTADARADNATAWNDTAPTSAVFTIGTTPLVNNTDDFVAYCFAEVEGYSRFGSYTGNGNADGTFVFLGFRPAWILIKKTNGSQDWQLMDTKRDSFNLASRRIEPNNNDAENNDTTYNNMDIVSNGFKIRATGGNTNTSGGTYIYMAFAENPFKYANAR